MPGVTFDSIGATHLLIVCPRGFANERSVYALPASCLEDAQKVEEWTNPQGMIDLTVCLPLEQCLPVDRSRAGKVLREYDTIKEYEDSLYVYGPLMMTLDI